MYLLEKLDHLLNNIAYSLDFLMATLWDGLTFSSLFTVSGFLALVPLLDSGLIFFPFGGGTGFLGRWGSN